MRNPEVLKQKATRMMRVQGKLGTFIPCTPVGLQLRTNFEILLQYSMDSASSQYDGESTRELHSTIECNQVLYCTGCILEIQAR